MSGLKDTARLLAYFAATALVAALGAPWLFWGAHALIGAGIFPWLARFDFETYFHRALLIAALVLAWPLLRSLRVRSWADLGLVPNARWLRDAVTGLALAAIPLLGTAAILVAAHVFALRSAVMWRPLVAVALSALVVPLIEETLFRGLLFGVIARNGRNILAAVSTAAVFSILHFLKAPAGTSASPTWSSGFASIANAFTQFRDPMLVLAGFTTLFLIGCILAHARIVTRSLWLPIGLHAGWIFTSGEFNKIAQRQMLVLPWIGKSLLVGLVPLGVALLTWALMMGWIRYVDRRNS